MSVMKVYGRRNRAKKKKVKRILQITIKSVRNP